MPAEKTSYNTIDEYIAAMPQEHRPLLQKLRQTIQAAAPQATERMSWQMPTFHQGVNLAHFALHKQHVGFYPGAEAMEHFAPRLKDYKTSKGAVQFPLSRPIPFELVTEMVTYNVARR